MKTRELALILLLAFSAGFVLGSVVIHNYVPLMLNWSTQEAYLTMTEKSAGLQRTAEYWKTEHDKQAAVVTDLRAQMADDQE